jgi:hypothetical protein
MVTALEDLGCRQEEQEGKVGHPGEKLPSFGRRKSAAERPAGRNP